MASAIIDEGQDVDINDSETKAHAHELAVSDPSDSVSSSKNGKLISNNNNNNLTAAAEHHFSTSLSSSSSSSSGVGPPSPPDGGWGWVIVFASFMINLIADGVSLSFGILFVNFVDYFGESKAKTSWVGSIFFSMPLLAGPIASYLSDRYGCRRVCIAGAFLATGAFIISIFATSLEILFLTFSIAGLGLALCYVTSIVVVAYYFEKKRSLATGLSSCGTGIGTFIFPPLTIYLLEMYTWQGTLLILSGVFLNMVIFGALMRDLDEYPKNGKPESKSPSDSGLEESERLCSSLVQLPTYLCDNLPFEVISEISSKEGGYLNSLLEQHPQLLNSFVANHVKDQAESPSDSRSRNSSFKKMLKPSIKKRPVPSVDPNIYSNHQTMQQEGISSSKLEASGYLKNIRFQRGSITYRGAMLNIRRYRLRASSCPDIYRNSMMTIDEAKSCLCIQDLKELLLDMFNFSIFKNFQYSLFCLSNFLLYACVDVPYVYIPDHASHQNVDKESASFLISFLGVLNTLGVVIVGYFGDKSWIDSTLLYSGFISVSGIMLAVIPWVSDYYGLAAVVGIYGFMISANYTLVPIIVVNIISLDSFTGAYGLLLLVQGIASLIGPPFAGLLSDISGNYDVTFFCTGICVLVSGIMVLPIANVFFHKKSSTISRSEESIKHNSRSEKVQFKEPIEMTTKGAISDSNSVKTGDSAINFENNEITVTTPFLSTANGDSDHSTILKLHKISVYENPLSSTV